MQWMHERGSRFVAVGRPFGELADATAGAEFGLRYPHDGDPVVALLVEVLVAELIAARWWADR